MVGLAAQVPSHHCPRRGAQRADHGDQHGALAEQVEQALDPTAEGIAATIDHGVDEVLGFVLGLRVQGRKQHLPTRAHKRVFTDTTRDHQPRQHGEGRRQRQADKAQTYHARHQRQQRRQPQLLRQAPGDEQLRCQRPGLHHEVDDTEHPDLLFATGKQLRDQPRLLEIQKRAHGGQQHHECTNAQQITRSQHARQSAERIARNGFARVVRALGTGSPCASGRPPGHEKMLERYRQRQQHRCHHRQPTRPQSAHQQRTDRRPHQTADAGPGGNESKQALGLGPIEHIGHQAPGDRDHKQVVDRNPHVKHPSQPHAVFKAGECHSEQHEIDAKEPVDPVDVMHPGDAGVEPAEQRDGDQHGHESGGEQPLQVLDAALNAHGFADGPQHEIAAEQTEEQRKPRHGRQQFARPGIDGPAHAGNGLAHSAILRRIRRRSAATVGHWVTCPGRPAGCRACTLAATLPE